MLSFAVAALYELNATKRMILLSGEVTSMVGGKDEEDHCATGERAFFLCLSSHSHLHSHSPRCLISIVGMI
jgi:hypothetical protein